MSKQSSVAAKPKINWLLGGLGALLIAAACVPTAAPIAEPTQMLIPSTATITPPPIPPTLPQATLPAPGDINPATPGIMLDSNTQTGDLLTVDPVAAELASIAQRRVAQELGLPTRRVRVVEVTPYTWVDTSLGCPLPGETYAPVSAEGYRILLSAGEEEYIFHTDFDRALPCDPANERLPEPTED